VKIRIVVGPVEIGINGLDVTERQVRRLMAEAGQIAARLLDDSPDAESEKQPMGFSATIERAPEPVPENYYSDDDE
jgi:hypothetical protein